MHVPRPLPITRSLFHFLARKPRINDILRHREMTMKLAESIALHGAMAAVFVWLVTNVFLGFGPALPFVTFLAFASWAALYLKAQNPVMSTLLWGGKIYIFNGFGGYNFTTEIGVVENKEILVAVEVCVPGVFFFLPDRRSELRPFKPHSQYVEIAWTAEAVADAMRAE
ncbi:MAG: hypothetical protein AAB473_03515 [Patescibacteria group bacterium]